jgi:hypothetical protein
VSSVQSMRRSARLLAHLAEAADRHDEPPADPAAGGVRDDAVGEAVETFGLDRADALHLLLQGERHARATAALPARLRDQARDLLLAATQLQDAEEQADAVEAALSDTLKEVAAHDWYEASCRAFRASDAVDDGP